MAYVEPNTDLQFFTNTGLNMGYSDTLYFPTSLARDQYWDARGKKQVAKCTYQRENRGYCRVEMPIRQLYNVDYMRFKNNNFEDKWFYAFVTGINYINNITTEVQYSIDVMMTWMGVFNLEPCFIARQHTMNDGIGNNICEEGLPVGPYICERQEVLWGGTPETYVASVALAYDGGSGSSGKTYGYIHSGQYTDDTSTSQSMLDAVIKDQIDDNNIDSLISITMIPQSLVNDNHLPVSFQKSDIPKPYTDIDGYVPRNKKLFCYPYKYCTVATSEGSQADFLYEYMGSTPDTTSTGNISFEIEGCQYANGAEVQLYPLNYKGKDAYETRLTITHFPQCGYAIDSYSAYLAQRNAYYPQEMALAQKATSRKAMAGALNGFNEGLSNASNIISMPDENGIMRNKFNGMTPGLSTVQGMAKGIQSGLMDEIALVDQHMVENEVRPEAPAKLHGSPASDLQFSLGNLGFRMYEKCITRNYAMMLDSYFDMFGYAIKQHGTPNMNARPHWTYVKTVGCNCNGMLPAEDKRAINQIFDTGCRFWHSLNEMGNYSLDNSPA